MRVRFPVNHWNPVEDCILQFALLRRKKTWAIVGCHWKHKVASRRHAELGEGNRRGGRAGQWGVGHVCNTSGGSGEDRSSRHVGVGGLSDYR